MIERERQIGEEDMVGKMWTFKVSPGQVGPLETIFLFWRLQKRFFLFDNKQGRWRRTRSLMDARTIGPKWKEKCWVVGARPRNQNRFAQSRFNFKTIFSNAFQSTISCSKTNSRRAGVEPRTLGFVANLATPAASPAKPDASNSLHSCFIHSWMSQRKKKENKAG